MPGASLTAVEIWLRPNAVRLALAALLGSLWLFAGTGQTHACSCVEPGPPAEALAESTIVFAGKVISIRGLETRVEGTWSTMDPVTIELHVSAVWKGSVQETMFVTTVRSEASCGFTFTEGREYVVYSRSDAIPPEVSLCSRTGLAANAQEDFDALGEGNPPEPGSKAPEPEVEQPRDAAGGCNILSQSARTPKDAWALGLIAGAALLASRRRTRR